MSQENLIINIGAKTSQLEKKLRSSKNKVVAFGAVLAASGTAAVAAINEYRKYEKALIGVGKTTGLVGDELKKYGDNIQDLAVKTGQSANSLLAISQAAGQLGVTGSERLQKFTDTIAKLGTASDLQGEDAATTLTRILNVTGEGVDNIDQFASVIVRLGNNFAASESEIARMAQEVSRATAVFGVSSAESAALGTALRSVGVQAELGGSVVGKSFRTIDDAVRKGGAELEALQVITGMTGDQLKETFKKDSTAVFQKFIEGLGKVKTEGGSVAEVLEMFGLKGDEVNKVLPVLAERSDLLGEALRHAGDEVANTTALEKEFAAQNDTLDQNFAKLSQSVVNLATDFGETLAPAVNFAVKEMTEDIGDFREGISAIGTIFSGVMIIIEESINHVLGKFDEFAAGSLRAVSSVIENFQAMADVLPFVEGSFQGTIDNINAKAEEYEQAARDRAERSVGFFGESEAAKTEALAVEQENRTVLADEQHEADKEADEERRQGKLELDEERREEDKELAEERHEDDVTTLLKQISEKQKAEEAATKTQKTAKTNIERDLLKIKKSRVDAEVGLEKELSDSAFSALSTIVGDSKAAQAAIFVIQKGMAVARTLANGVEASMLAYASQLIPGDPTSIARAEAARQMTLASSQVQAIVIAATAIPEIATTFAAKEGGMIPGRPMGDKPFGFMEGQEIIVPARLNKTFQELFPSFPNGEEEAQGLRSSGTQSVSVMVGLTDDAADILTVQQYESKVIGTSR